MKLHNLLRYAILLPLVLMPALQADEVDDLIVAQMKERQIPGLSLAVIRDGKVLRSSGYGMANLEHQVPATQDTVYEIGSISKQFAAEAVMLLVEDGKLKLQDPITDYLPTNAPEDWRTLTISDLLRHTSGLKDWTEVDTFSYRRPYTGEEFIELVRAYPLEFRAKDNWKYSNTNLPLVGLIVERASGTGYEAFVTDRILNQLSCPSIRFHDQKEIVSHRASGYVLINGKLEHGEPFRPKIISPSGGVLANVVDLARWWESLLNGKLIQPRSLDEILLPTQLNDGRKVSHGLSIFWDSFQGHRMIHHHGSTMGGFGSVVRHFPAEKLTIAAMCNLEDGGWCAEYVSKRVANHYIPGSFIGGLAPRNDDAAARIAEAHLLTLKKIAANERAELLAESYVPKITQEFRDKTAKNLSMLTSFLYLGKESIGQNHFVMDSALNEVHYFKMTMGNRSQYYHFRCYSDGKVGWIVVED